MRALKFYQTGSLDDLHVEEVTVPIPAAGEVLVEVKAAAINPGEAMIRRGAARARRAIP